MKSLNLDELLRYVFAGSIALATVFLRKQGPIEWIEKHEEIFTLHLGATIFLIGALIYILHRAFLYPIVWRFLRIVRSLIQRSFKDHFNENFKLGQKWDWNRKGSCWRGSFSLSNWRMLAKFVLNASWSAKLFIIPWHPTHREVKTDISRWNSKASGKSIYNGLTEWASQVHFLYCTTWAILLASEVSKLWKPISSPRDECWSKYTFVACIITGAVAVCHHYRYLWLEGKVEEWIPENSDKVSEK